MHPNHIPEFRDALPPIASRRLDGRATNVITRQEDRLVEEIGRIDRAHIPSEGNTPLYGYRFEINNNTGAPTEIDLTIATNPRTGEPIDPADKEFVDARNRVAVLRSRERSRGSRILNYAFMRNRGDGPGGHGYDITTVEEDYHEQLSDFIARKVSGANLNSAARVTQAVSRAIIQEQRQMSALENMAAEQKSGNRFLNFLRNHKKLRFATGIALTGIAAVGVATGQLEVAIPAMAARTALSGTGGYVLGRTAWDAFQGRRARRVPEDDPRMAGSRNGDFSGQLTPEAAFRRLIKLHGAEARAASHNPRRQELVRRLGSGLVHQYYTDELDFSHSRSAARIKDQVLSLYGRATNGIREQQEERLRSDQTQSRRRHVAGVVGGIALGALPGTRLAGFIDLGHVDIGGHAAHAHTAHIGSHGGSSKDVSNTGTGSSAAYHNGNVAAGSSPNGSADVYITGGSGNNTIYVEAMHQQPAGHSAQLAHGAESHHGHAAHVYEINGIPIGELHVKAGGGFISTLQEQYHLSPAQADATYRAMYSSLHNAPGTYMDGSDIRISAPGNFKLPDSARAVLEEKLKALHKMPNLHGNIAELEARTGGTAAPEGSALSDHIGSAIHNGTGGTAAPEVGMGHDAVKVLTPGSHTPQGQALRAMVQGSYVPETNLHGLTAQQIANAKTYMTELIHHHEFSGLSSNAKDAIEIYVKASLDSPGPRPAAHEAADAIRNLLSTIHSNYNSLTPEQIESLQENLAVINGQ